VKTGRAKLFKKIEKTALEEQTEIDFNKKHLDLGEIFIADKIIISSLSIINHVYHTFIWKSGLK
jgi:hypothetical protein